jgi:V/A-type H+-transporting ATPase subunit E
MAVQVQEIIDRIKAEGIQATRAEAEGIIAGAKAEAAAELARAQVEAKAILEKARAEAERELASGKAALANAARDTMLLLRKEIQGLADSLILKDVKEAMGGDTMAALLPAVIKAMGQSAAGASISLPEADFRRLESRLHSLLAEELRAGLTLKPHARLKSGFRISMKEGAAYYDYSAEAVAEALSQLLGPSLAALVRQQTGGAGA